MKLLNGHILIRVDEAQKQTKSGLYLTENAVRLPQTGTVEAVADEVTEVKVGDKVAFLRYAAIDGVEEDTRLCKIEHILGVYSADETA
jgi:co-chaperonin GroES (HSP10)